MSRPPLDSLVVFEACARHLNFTRAAAELAVTPAAVSSRMRDLEHDLGVKLFHRSGPHVSLTEHGSNLAMRVGVAIGELRSAVDACRAATPTLRVTSAPSFALRWLAPRLDNFRSVCPELVISLDVSSEVRDSTSFDVAVRTGLGDWRDCDARVLMPLAASPMLSPVLASKHQVTTPADLKSLPLLPHDDWPRWFEAAGSQADGLTFSGVEFSLHDLNATAAMNGVGVALLSPILYADLLCEGRLVQPFAQVIDGPDAHYVLVPKQQRHPKADIFCDWLLASAQLDQRTTQVNA